MNTSDLLILEKLNELISETITLQNEVRRIRTRMDSRCYQIGKKYKIIEDSDLPTDKTFRNAWTVDESDLTDGTGSAS